MNWLSRSIGIEVLWTFPDWLRVWRRIGRRRTTNRSIWFNNSVLSWPVNVHGSDRDLLVRSICTAGEIRVWNVGTGSCLFGGTLRRSLQVGRTCLPLSEVHLAFGCRIARDSTNTRCLVQTDDLYSRRTIVKKNTRTSQLKFYSLRNASSEFENILIDICPTLSTPWSLRFRHQRGTMTLRWCLPALA